MIFDRQKRLLALLDALGGEASRLDFQKLLFLFCREAEDRPSYEFVPYKFGGFSFTSYADRNRLIERGLLADEGAWKLTASGRLAAHSLASPVRMCIDEFARGHAGLRGDALVATAYGRHPYYAIRSEITARVLYDDIKTLGAIAAAQPVAVHGGLCTIGYEGRTLEGYLNRLILDGVALLCDVRRNPLSRKYGFSKGTLRSACEGVGIRYEHLPELGIASEDRGNLVTQGDYDALFAAYERDWLPRQSTALSRIADWINAGQHVALTCYERLPQQCHRHCVADALAQLMEQSSPIKHL